MEIKIDTQQAQMQGEAGLSDGDILPVIFLSNVETSDPTICLELSHRITSGLCGNIILKRSELHWLIDQINKDRQFEILRLNRD